MLLIYFNINWIKIFYINNIIEKVLRSIYVYIFKFITRFQFILLIWNSFHFVL